MKRKISKIIFALLAPIACFLLIGIFSFSNISGFSSAVDYGGAVYVGNKSTLNMTSGTIRGFSANYGGGVYIASGGTFNLSGGSIYGNSSSYSAGKDIYNSGTFTMTGGTVGSSGTTVTSGIYNYGTMNLYGGSVYDDIYSPSQLTYTKMAVNISGTINLSTIGTITVQDYAGTTPTYKINLTTSRGLGAIVVFIGSSTAPDLSKLSISGYDDSKYMVATEKNSSGNWTVALKDKTIYFPSTWKTELESTDYMTTTVSERDISGIRFEKTVPSGYSQIGTLTTGIKVYRSTSDTSQIAFVHSSTIYAPVNSNSLFICPYANFSSISFNNFDTSKATSMASFFMGCKFATLDLSSFDTRKVTDFSNFVGSSYLTTLILGSNFKTSSATNFFYMFAGCSSLTSLDLSGFDTSNVTSTYCMFNGCSSLTRLDLSSFNTSKVTTMYHMFANCTNLKYLDISSFNMSKVTVVTNMLMFGSSNKIETLKTPYNNTAELPITTGSTLYNEAGNVVTSVPANTFSSLTYTNTLPYKTFPETWKTEIASTTYMTTTVDANNLTSIKFEFSAPSGYSQIGTLSTGIKVYKSTSSSTQIAFVNEKTIYAPENCSYMFDLMTSLKSITFNNFDTSKTTTMVNMFSNCDFTTLDLSGFDTSNVTSFNAFIQGVTYMTSLKLGTKFDTSKSTDFQYMFQGCMSLTTLDLSMFNTSKAIYMNCMFQSCSGLTSLDLSKFNMKSATYVSDMLNFGSSNKIKIIKTPYKNSISIGITTGSSLYDVSTGLSAPQLPANVTASKTYSTKVVLNFDAVGGTCSTSSITGYYGVSLYDIGKSLPTPTKIGYTFEGWSSSMGSITNATKLYLDSPAKITAKWTEGEESNLQIKETLSEVISNAFASNGIDYDDNYVNELIFYSNFNIHYEPFSAQEYSSFSSDAGWRLLGTYIGSNVYYIKHTEGVYSVAFVCDIDEGFTIKVEDFVNAFAPFNALTSLDMSGVSVEDPTNTTVAQLPGSLQVFATPISWSNPTFSYVDMSGAFLSLESANGTQIDQVTHFQYSNVFGQGGFWFGGEPTLAYIEVSSNPITMDDEYNWSFNGSYLVGYVPYNRTLMKYIPIELNVWPSDYSEQGYWEIVGGDVCYIVVDDISTFIDSDGYVHFIQAYQVSSFLEQDNKNQFEIEMDGEISISYSETCILPEKKGFVVEIEKDKKVG